MQIDADRPSDFAAYGNCPTHTTAGKVPVPPKVQLSTTDACDGRPKPHVLRIDPIDGVALCHAALRVLT
jgi:hypothetical protein